VPSKDVRYAQGPSHLDGPENAEKIWDQLARTSSSKISDSTPRFPADINRQPNAVRLGSAGCRRFPTQSRSSPGRPFRFYRLPSLHWGGRLQPTKHVASTCSTDLRDPTVDRISQNLRSEMPRRSSARRKNPGSARQSTEAYRWFERSETRPRTRLRLLECEQARTSRVSRRSQERRLGRFVASNVP
jgi:hypothetical protein